MIDILDKLQHLTELGKSVEEKQNFLNVNEVYCIWDILVSKLDIMETTQLLENFIDDADLRIISNQLVKGLQSGITDMESLMKNYNIPFPPRPPAGNNTTTSLEDLNDKVIYENILEGIQTFFPILSHGFMNSTSPKVRKIIKNHLLLTLELQEQIVEYGKLKNYLNIPPVYNP